MALFLLHKCHSGNCLCSLIDWSGEMATQSYAPVAHTWTCGPKREKIAGEEAEEEDGEGMDVSEGQLDWDCSRQS